MEHSGPCLRPLKIIIAQNQEHNVRNILGPTSKPKYEVL